MEERMSGDKGHACGGGQFGSRQGGIPAEIPVSQSWLQQRSLESPARRHPTRQPLAAGLAPLRDHIDALLETVAILRATRLRELAAARLGQCAGEDL
jgi:hypothetical protein